VAVAKLEFSDKRMGKILGALFRISCLVLIVMPVVFVSLIALCGWTAHQLAREWSLEECFTFMAAVVTGGAIARSSEAQDPEEEWMKVLGALLGSMGVGSFAFLVAAVSYSAAEPLTKFVGLDRPNLPLLRVLLNLFLLTLGVVCSFVLFALPLGAFFELDRGLRLRERLQDHGLGTAGRRRRLPR